MAQIFLCSRQVLKFLSSVNAKPWTTLQHFTLGRM